MKSIAILLLIITPVLIFAPCIHAKKRSFYTSILINIPDVGCTHAEILEKIVTPVTT